MIHPAISTAALVLGAAAATPATAQMRPVLSYGVAITSNYISKGTTQSDDNPALQGYVEGSYGMFYGGVWSSTVDFGDDPDYGNDNVEVDLFAGARRDFGDVSADLGYYRYYYDDSGDCCGEWILALGYPMADIGAVGAEYRYDPQTHNQWGTLSAAVGFLTAWEVGGEISTDFGSWDLGFDKVVFDLGVTRALADFAAVDLRYYTSNDDPDHLVLTISADF